jgi:uncharacterized protein (DUF2062 family)
MSGNKTFLADLIRKNMPKRQQLEGNRWTRPLARRHELWRFTRRSVPRGVAVGLLVGIFALIPGVQIVGAALMCVPGRGNIPIAAAMTFLSNPATTPFILIVSAIIGNKMGFHADVATVQAMVMRGASASEWLGWFLSDAAPAILVGLAIFSVLTASVGYLLASAIWRVLVGRKRARRLKQMELRLDQRLEAEHG